MTYTNCLRQQPSSTPRQCAMQGQGPHGGGVVGVAAQLCALQRPKPDREHGHRREQQQAALQWKVLRRLRAQPLARRGGGRCCTGWARGRPRRRCRPAPLPQHAVCALGRGAVLRCRIKNFCFVAFTPDMRKATDNFVALCALCACTGCKHRQLGRLRRTSMFMQPSTCSPGCISCKSSVTAPMASFSVISQVEALRVRV